MRREVLVICFVARSRRRRRAVEDSCASVEETDQDVASGDLSVRADCGFGYGGNRLLFPDDAYNRYRRRRRRRRRCATCSGSGGGGSSSAGYCSALLRTVVNSNPPPSLLSPLSLAKGNRRNRLREVFYRFLALLLHQVSEISRGDNLAARNSFARIYRRDGRNLPLYEPLAVLYESRSRRATQMFRIRMY